MESTHPLNQRLRWKSPVTSSPGLVKTSREWRSQWIQFWRHERAPGFWKKRQRSRRIAVPATDDPTFVLPISAKSQEALRESIDLYREFLESGARGASLADACYTAGLRRAHHNHRFAAVGSTVAEMVNQLSSGTGKSSTPEVSKPAFVFSGQGSHWQHMGEDSSRTEPVFRQVMEKCGSPFCSTNRLVGYRRNYSGERLNETDASQGRNILDAVGLAALWRSWGILPHAVVGQSLGEIVAAHIAGALSLESAVTVVYHRSRLMKSVSRAGQNRCRRTDAGGGQGDDHRVGRSLCCWRYQSGRPASSRGRRGQSKRCSQRWPSEMSSRAPSPASMSRFTALMEPLRGRPGEFPERHRVCAGANWNDVHHHGPVVERGQARCPLLGDEISASHFSWPDRWPG